MITELSQLDLKKRYTFADYLTWKLRERIELIRGYIHKMSPAPGEAHQRVSSFLHGFLWNFLHGKTCQVRHAPYDVRLTIPSDTALTTKRKQQTTPVSDGEIRTVLQPDLLVICDPEKIDEKGCLGAPDLVVEILSAGNNQNDLVEKFNIYEAAGVREYWIVHPYEQSITIYSLDAQGKYIGSKPYAPGEIITSGVLAELQLPVEEVFA